MIHLPVFVLCVAGFAALASSVRRQQRDLFGGSLRRNTTIALRAGGTVVLLLALAILVAWRGWAFGLVMFSGHTSIGAGIVYLGLAGYGQLRA